MENKSKRIEEIFKQDLSMYLTGRQRVDEQLPDAPDIEEQWAKIGESYLPDAMREFSKLNRETLEIEKPAKLKFEIGKLYVFNDEDEDGKVSVIGKVIGKNESDGTLTFGEQYDIENEHFVTNETFYLNISLHKELREATELEAELFAKHRSIRLKEEKEAREQPDFKTFDKVLVRCGEKFKWLPAPAD